MRLARAICGCFLCLLLLPTLQNSFGLFPEFPLIGAESPAPKPVFSLSRWFSGRYQQEYEQRRALRLGLRAHLVRSNNQLHYTLFGRINSGSGTGVLIGEQDWLYERSYVGKWRQPAADEGGLIEVRAVSLRRLQDLLTRRSIAFAVVLAPSKPEIYPEYLPAELRRPVPSRPTDYALAVEAFNRHGIALIDGHRLFLEAKERMPHYQLFGPSGTHWNKYGAYLAWQSLAGKLNPQLRKPILVPRPVAILRQPPEPVEADLGRFLNLWDPALSAAATDYPEFAQPAAVREDQPSLLLVGDSFLYTLVDIIDRAYISRDVDAFFYFKRHIRYPVVAGRLLIEEVPEGVALEGAGEQWVDVVLGKDAVILVMNEYWLPEVGWGFVEMAIERLSRLEAESTQ